MKYVVFEATTAQQMGELVAPMLREGWKPQGGVTLAVWTEPHRDGYVQTYFQWAQALVKEE